jgi:hypothetical protein
MPDGIVVIAPRDLARLRALLKDHVTLEHAYAESNAHHRCQGAAASLIEALMLSLRERCVAALSERATHLRLAQLSAAQVDEVGDRLQRLQSRPWTSSEVDRLIRTRGHR